jgi:hypothetical protein
VGLFRRRKPLHEQLATAGDLSLGFDTGGPTGLSGQPPGWDGEQRGEPGIHGVPRARRWDAVATTGAPGLGGDNVHFIALTDGTLVVEEDEPDDALVPLAEAVEASIPPPYRAEAVRRGPETWAVAASRIAIATVPGLNGDRAELVVTRDGRTLNVDGRATLGHAPALERIGQAEGTEYVVRAERVDGDLWTVEATAL